MQSFFVGIAILLDYRFDQPSIRQQLSPWIQEGLREGDENWLYQITDFFNRIPSSGIVDTTLASDYLDLAKAADHRLLKNASSGNLDASLDLLEHTKQVVEVPLRRIQFQLTTKWSNELREHLPSGNTSVT